MSKKQQKENEEKRGRGSILIGIILIFILISSIAIAVIGRSKQGATIATDSKKGYNAYQDSDSNTEKILNEIKELDSEDLRIPESVPASDVCDGVCYESDRTGIAGKVADIFFIKKEGESQNMKRAIFAPVPDRLVNPVSNLAVLPGSPNRCDARLTLTYDSSADLTKVDSLELRKSLSNSLTSEGWKRLEENSSSVTAGTVSVTIKNSEFNYLERQYFSLKAKNKDSFQLDSLYYSKPTLPLFIAPNAANCPGGALALGCLEYPVTKGAHKSSLYSCCGNTECYVCNTGWKADSKDSLKCCTEIYQPTSCPCGVQTPGKENKCDKYTKDICKSCP